MKVRVDPDLCVGHGRCYALAPEVFEPDDFGHCIGRDVRLPRDRPQYRQPLGRHLNAPFTKKRRRIGDHRRR